MSTHQGSNTPLRTVKTVTTTTIAASPNGVLNVRTKTTTTSLFKVDARYRTPVAISSDESGQEDDDPTGPALSSPPSPPPSPSPNPPAASLGHSSSSLVSSISSLSLTPSTPTSPHASPPAPIGIPPPSAFNDLPRSARYYVVTRGTRVGIFTSWTEASQYVLGVSGASHSKSRTLAKALAEYEEAYNQGTVTFLSV
ncbi:hypothetical protein V5O48_013749 [Marasmius crinis-equi]|uniref:Ribonuclease H1 N-terminal domain-containing protein n=1 Tax=Marasmius crinis-equi TaxID=585013 RepID=A0ABR3EZ73_9AGAR